MYRSYFVMQADSQQYSMWNRTRRLSTTPYLAQADTRASRQATAMANNPALAPGGDIVINMGDLSREKKQDTLFGPNIGIVPSGPAWTDSEHEKQKVLDELTPEIVKTWVEKSKESIQPTTTLQALVNLKRPTLRLSPLELHPSDDPDHVESHHHHALEFEYDCDAPKCGIFVHVILTPEQQRAENAAANRVLVYETTVDGGFARVLKLEDGATLELGRFEHREAVAAPAESTSKLVKTPSTPELPELPSQPTAPSVVETPVTDPRQERKRRFTTALNFRRRTQDRSVSGPALAVVDADASPETDVENKVAVGKDEQTEEGVRVVIRLVALDEDGKELPSANEQSTYLHVVRFGPPAAEGDDVRPWVVKVAKREATIGPHTFHLHEIYGLSSAPAHTPAPAVPVPTSPHAYPPTAPPVPTPHEDEPSSECLVCLSSPREVVLLPCRHLVACKECAVNMVEFGAGGAIVNAEEPSTTAEPPAPETAAPSAPDAPAGTSDSTTAPPATDSAEAHAEAPPAEGSPSEQPAVVPITPIPTNPRRKRRAKGWFCPVCRQPYTSLLRITTTPPVVEDKEGKRVSTSTMDHPLDPATPAPVIAQAAVPEQQQRSSRPSFFRGLSRAGRNHVEPASAV
ncbi:hypothetical protein FA95DRAFT_1553769 [Auriscalpium vulgare]|uniref:Uncharacterized protein n=1 Tax=Auriscalpium vulgare TaxID=40419 RepID=A0ACB8S812_9AGAM|nr:hypothetical protein FA95DRAFT_1553769 [Auriscalpium vulgare]